MLLEGRRLLRPETIKYVEPVGDLWELSKGETHIYKWHNYYEQYEKRLAQYRDRPVKMLEIGVHYGGSVKVWSKFFHPDSKIVGIDIDPRCAVFSDGNILVEIGDQADLDFLARIVEDHGPFDIIIDDGSHLSEHQRISWQYLFMNGLVDGGLYCVEDTYNSYFPGMTPGVEAFLKTVVSVIDLMHMNYLHAGNTKPFVHRDPAGFEIDVEYYEAHILDVSISEGQVFFSKALKSAPHAPKVNRPLPEGFSEDE